MNYVCCRVMSERKYIHDLKWAMPAKFSLGISDRLEELWDATLWFSVFRTRGWLAWRTLSLCFEMGFMRKFLEKQNATEKVKLEVELGFLCEFEVLKIKTCLLFHENLNAWFTPQHKLCLWKMSHSNSLQGSSIEVLIYYSQVLEPRPKVLISSYQNESSWCLKVNPEF